MHIDPVTLIQVSVVGVPANGEWSVQIPVPATLPSRSVTAQAVVLAGGLLVSNAVSITPGR